MFSVLYYFTFVVTKQDRDDYYFKGPALNIILRCIILVSTLVLFGLEGRQFNLKRWEHIKDLWSILQFSSYILNLTIVGIHASKIKVDMDYLTQTASLATFILWMLMLYWMRLSYNLSFYVDIVKNSIYDIRYFLLMLILMIFTFSNALIILDYSNKDEYEESMNSYQSFITDVSGDTFLSSLIQQFLLGLGSVPTDNIINNKYRYLIWFYFIIAVIVTNVAFFNILIAIVSDSYERIMESKERSDLIQQVELTTEFIDFIRFDTEFTSSNYLYFIEPILDDSQIQEWDGGLKLIERTSKLQEKRLSQKLDAMQSQFVN